MISRPRIRPRLFASVKGRQENAGDQQYQVVPPAWGVFAPPPFSVTLMESTRGREIVNVEDWLRGIGMTQYVERFRSNAIDSEMLRRLSSDDLKDIGVAALGQESAYVFVDVETLIEDFIREVEKRRAP